LEFEVYVQDGFSQLELAAVLAALGAANDVKNTDEFTWTVVSDTPGLVSSGNEILVRASPVITGEYLHDCLIVVGGRSCDPALWMPRLRAMQKRGRPTVLLSDAASAFIRKVGRFKGPITTHWRDHGVLAEVDDFPTLSERLSETNDHIITCAGQTFVPELIIELLTKHLNAQEKTELASLLMIQEPRNMHRDQPKGVRDSASFLEPRLQKALKLMEEQIEYPLRVSDLADQVGVSTRQLERMFHLYLTSSPAKVYKKIRLKRARDLVEETRKPLIDIALACGFSAMSTMSRAYRQEFGETPNQARKRKGTP
jgi:transcriptional regulator GlxA family with amidase domain